MGISINYKGEDLELLLKYVCSGNINFIMGSGASFPAIKTLGNLEKEITSLIIQNDKGVGKNFKREIVGKINDFILDSTVPNKLIMKVIKPEKSKNKVSHQFVRTRKYKLTNESVKVIKYFINISRVLVNYEKFIRVIYELLLMRASDKYPKKINIFTTNYDLFFEAACEILDFPYNDGGNGYIRRTFSTKNFQKKIIRLSDYYAYSYEEPIINILK